MTFISPSRLLINSLGIEPVSSGPALSDGFCAMCGEPHGAGDRVEPWVPADSFNDRAQLKQSTSPVICSACAAVNAQGRDFTQIYTKSIVSADGIYPFFSNDAVAHWLLNPPKPPFAAFISTKQVGHIVWKTPVSLSTDVFYVRYDDLTLKIDRKLLVEGAAAARALGQRLAENLATKKTTTKEFINPVILSRDLTGANHGVVKTEVLELVENEPSFRPALDKLKELGPGELWGLTALLYAKAPAKPESRYKQAKA